MKLSVQVLGVEARWKVASHFDGPKPSNTSPPSNLINYQIKVPLAPHNQSGIFGYASF